MILTKDKNDKVRKIKVMAIGPWDKDIYFPLKDGN